MTGLLFSTQGGGINPSGVDSDSDGMPDAWENAYGLNSLFDDSSQDGDGDGLSNIQEFALLTNPMNIDSDMDGLSDGDENGQYSTNPLLADTDGDGYLDGFEINNGGDPLSSANYPGSSAHQSYGTTLAWNINSASGWMLGEKTVPRSGRAALLGGSDQSSKHSKPEWFFGCDWRYGFRFDWSGCR